MITTNGDDTIIKVNCKKTVLITGASSGIGHVTAKLFAQNGYLVYATSRNCKEETQKIGSGYIIFRKMDVTDSQSINVLVNLIEDIEIVIHCAGYGIAGPAEEVPIEMAMQQMDTNYFGVLRVNSCVLPRMRLKKSGLIVVISSVAGKVSIPFQSHYSSSKFALEAYAEALRMELKPFQIGVALIEPGDTKTEFTARREIWCADQSVYKERCLKAIGKMEKDEQNGRSPEEIANLAYKLAQKKRYPLRQTAGLLYKLVLFLQSVLPSHIFNGLIEKYYL